MPGTHDQSCLETPENRRKETKKEKEDEWTVEEHTNAVREMFGSFPDPIPWKPAETATPKDYIGPTVNGVPYNPEKPLTP